MESRLKKVVRWMAERKQLRERQKTKGPRRAEVCLYGLVDSFFPLATWEGCGAPKCELSCFGNAECQSPCSHGWMPGCA